MPTKDKETEVYDLNGGDKDETPLCRAAEVIRQGGTVIFPTETVYGLGANALSEDAVRKIFEAKDRPSDNPLIVHVSSMDMLVYIIGEPLSHTAKLLIQNFWPGPLTLVFKKSKHIPYAVTVGLETVAVRMPDHRTALALIEKSGLPIAAPSANLSGKPSPTTSDHVLSDMRGRVDVILCGDQSRVGVESTVLDLTGDVPVILRPGGVTYEQLNTLLGQVDVDPGLLNEDIIPKSPGMKYTHYKPNADMVIIKGDMNRVKVKIQDLVDEKTEEGLVVGVLASVETYDFYKNCKVVSMGSRIETETAARQIFAALRSFDELGVDIIFSEALDEKDIGTAVMNRMKKAAGFNIIEVAP